MQDANVLSVKDIVKKVVYTYGKAEIAPILESYLNILEMSIFMSFWSMLWSRFVTCSSTGLYERADAEGG